MARTIIDVPILDFFNSSSTPLTESKISKGVNLGGGNYQQLALEVKCTGSANIIVESTILTNDSEGAPLADEDCMWTPMGILDAYNFDLLGWIERSGIYYVPLVGTLRVRVVAQVLNGEVVVTGVLS